MHTQIAQLAYLMLKQKKKGDNHAMQVMWSIKPLSRRLCRHNFTIYHQDPVKVYNIYKKCKGIKKNQCRDMVAYHQNLWTNAEKTCDLWWQWQKISRLVSRIHVCFWPSHGKNRACVDVSWLHGRMYSEINNPERCFNVKN